MTLPFSLPAWMPWWLPAAILVPILLYALLFLAVPFSVFGLKGRLDNLEARLDEIQGEIRALVLRLPEPDRDTPPAARRETAARPPIPPPALAAHAAEPFTVAAERPRFGTVAAERPRFGTSGEEPRRRPAPPLPAPSPARRAEPRIDWPPMPPRAPTQTPS